MHHFKEIIENYSTSGLSSTELMAAISEFHPVFNHIEEKNETAFWDAMKGFHEKVKGHHFDEMYAKYQVKGMYHTKHNGTICRGEIYSHEEAKTIYDKHVRNIHNSYTIWDVYVAINAQYHDYSRLYYEWFENITTEQMNEKIIHSAITFWFKDEDADPDKIWDYFNDMD